MQQDQVQALLDTFDRGYLSDQFAPVHEEVVAENLTVHGELPRELTGMFCRNSPNPQFEPLGRYHWFDGDGMIHGLHVENGKATYRNKWVRTRSFEHEGGVGAAQWPGILDPVRMDLPGGPIKNTSNTDLVYHAGKLLSLWWLGGDPYEISVPELDTVGVAEFGRRLDCGMSAHPKVDPRTGEMVFMDFSFFKPPFLQYGRVSAKGELISVVPIEIPAPRILHDLAITQNHTILLDLPLGWDPQAMRKGKRKIAFDDTTPSRFGIMPRDSDGTDVRWFECPPCYIYHTINAWEEGDEVVLIACRVDNPMPTGDWAGEVPRLYFLQLQPFLHKWRFNLVTGDVKEERLDDRPSEFPRMNDDLLGVPTRYSYNPRIASEPQLMFDGVIKYDTQSGTSEAYDYGAHRFGGEVVFAPRDTGESEDDGWLMTFVHDRRAGRSDFVVLDARDVSAGPVATVELPVRVPPGFHACWVPGPF